MRGATITFLFDKAVEFCGFEYIPGYAKSQETYGANSVPTGFKITAADETWGVMSYSLKEKH